MQQRSHPEHLEGPTPLGAQAPGKSRDRRLWSSGTSVEPTVCCCVMGRAPLWAWLLLGALLAPGARGFLNEEQEELLVELHNYYRGQVSPSASAMLPLKWDPNLKLIAEGYAANCIWNHNPDLEETGENLFAGTGPLDLRVAVEKWFLEHLDYNFDNNSCDEDKMCGHYTQMVWGDTHRVGCAFHLCNNMEGLDWERVSFLVCNYYPAGNYEGERPYVEGDWCSRCPENLQKCENNLCVSETEEEEEEEVAGEDEDEDEEGEVGEEVEEEEEDVKVDQDEDEQEKGTAAPSMQTPHFISVDVNVPTAPPDGDSTPSTAPSRPEAGPEDTPPPGTRGPQAGPEDTPPPGTRGPQAGPEDTPIPGTRGPEKPSATVEKEVKDEDRSKKEDQRREHSGRKDVETRNVPPAAASVILPSLLVVCLTAVLTVEL